MSKWINKDFMINHYFSMLTDPTPDVSENDKRKARIVLDALKMTKGVEIVFCKECKKDGTHRCPYKVAKWGYTDDDFCSCGERRNDD